MPDRPRRRRARPRCEHATAGPARRSSVEQRGRRHARRDPGAARGRRVRGAGGPARGARSVLALLLPGAAGGGRGRDLRHEVRARPGGARRRRSAIGRPEDARRCHSVPTLRDRARGRRALLRRVRQDGSTRRAPPGLAARGAARAAARRRRAAHLGPSAPVVARPQAAEAHGAPSGALESAAMTIFQSAQGAGRRPGRPRRRRPRPAARRGAPAAALGDAPRRRPRRERVRPAAQPPRTSIGRTLNHRYLVEDKIGEGGFGAVFRGKQIATGPRGRAQDPAPAQPRRSDDRRALPPRGRGLLEAARPAHRHHLRLRRDRGRHPLPGDGAAARPEPAPPPEDRRALAPERVLAILDQVARVAGRGAPNGIVHRDMKPENVFIETRRGAAARTTSRCSTSASRR